MASRVVLKVGGRCNCDCRFCHAGGPRTAAPELSTREVCRRMLLAARAGHDGVVLSGGEPTLRQDLISLARFAAAQGLGFGVVTNGVALADERLRQALLRAGLGYALVSLHGPDRATHDDLSGVRSFDAACETVSALARHGLELAVSTVVCRPNVARVEEVVALVAELLGDERSSSGWPRHRLALLEPKGRAEGSEVLIPDPGIAAASIGRAVEARAGRKGPRLGHDGLPPCLAPACCPAPDDLRAHGITAMQEVEEEELFPTDAGRRSYGDRCESCALRPSCPGLYAGYLPRWSRALLPISE